MAKMKSGAYKGVDMKNVPYWSQPGPIKKSKDYVDPKSPKAVNPYKKYNPKKYKKEYKKQYGIPTKFA